MREKPSGVVIFLGHNTAQRGEEVIYIPAKSVNIWFNFCVMYARHITLITTSLGYYFCRLTMSKVLQIGAKP